ncbi:MAG: WecB/TagA/CpsF family glycosyltransferase, partial [Candidatus Chisholmbacteria bacterium]|nr:WecB/TagA/CpsF family glycosyltransferase [Candidatus Chisholmbacteria bacterium]
RPRQKLAGSHLGGQAFFIVTPNPEQIVLAQSHTEFKNALNSSDLAIADGWGIVVAARLLRITNYELRITERVSGIELFESLVKRAAEERWSVMLVGGRGDTAAEAAKILNIINHISYIKGTEGLRDAKNPDKDEEKRLIEQINEYEPDLLFVGFGAPWQELFVARNLSKLQVKAVMVVGGALDQIAHPSLRPPKVIDRMGLGWLYRLVRQPWRSRRQLRLLRFVGMVLRAWWRGNQVPAGT